MIDITVYNYRCFENSKPLRFSLDKEYIAFVGPNNAGKSAVMKFLYEFRNLWKILSSLDSSLPGACQGFPGFSLNGVSDKEEIFCNLNSEDILINLDFKYDYPSADDSTQYFTKLKLRIRRQNELGYKIAELHSNGVKRDLGDKNATWDRGNFSHPTVIINPSKTFDIFKILSGTFYIGPFRSAIDVTSDAEYYDIVVGRKFIQLWNKYYTGEKEKIKKTKSIQKNIKELLGFQFLNIHSTSDFKTLLVDINDITYRLEEVGSGISQFIVVLGNIALRDIQPSFILIDEPELNLHPNLQRKFLEILRSYSKHGVLFASHSLPLVQSCSQKIYSVTKDETGKTLINDYEKTTNITDFIKELTFNNIQDIGYEGVLLVEGIDDIKTFKQFLRLYKREHAYIVLSLKGEGLINKNRELELNEIRKLSTKIYAIIDSEKNSANDKISTEREEFEKICKKLNIELLITNNRATENYLTQKAIQAVMGNQYTALGPYEPLSSKTPHWGKNKNWEIASHMILDDIKETDVGNFLKHL